MCGQRCGVKILIIEMSNLGDAILTYPALGALWGKYPQAEFHLLATPRTKELFEGEPRVHRVWVLEKGDSIWKKVGLIWKLLLKRFDLVVDFKGSLIPFFILARRAPGSLWPPPLGMHRALRPLALISGLGIQPANGSVPLPYGPEEEKQVSEWIQPGKLTVVVVPGSKSQLKRWPADRFAAVADRLAQEQGAQILLVGAGDEREQADAVKSRMRYPVTDLVGLTSIRELAALMAKAKLVITNDNACMHAADAMGAPTVAIFGPTNEKKYGPRNPKSKVVRLNLVCAPCELALCPYGHECMKWLPAEEVFSAAKKVLLS